MESITPFDGGRYLLLAGTPITPVGSTEPFYRAILVVGEEHRLVNIFDATAFEPRVAAHGVPGDFIPHVVGGAAAAPRFFVGCRQVRRMALKVLEFDGEVAFPIAEDFGRLPLALSPDGRLLLTQSFSELRVFEVDDSALRPLEAVFPWPDFIPQALATADGWWVPRDGRLVLHDLETLEVRRTHDVRFHKSAHVRLSGALENPRAVLYTERKAFLMDLESGEAQPLDFPLEESPSFDAVSMAAWGDNVVAVSKGQLAFVDTAGHWQPGSACFHHGHTPPEQASGIHSVPSVFVGPPGWLYRLVDSQMYWDDTVTFLGLEKVDADAPSSPEPASPEPSSPEPLEPTDLDHPLARQLDELLAAFQAKGIDPTANLRPGLGEQDLVALLAPLPFQTPEAVRILFRWRNGHRDPMATPDRLLWFRDCPLLSLEEAIEVRDSLLAFGAYGDLENTLPFAGMDGVYLGVLCAGPQVGRVYTMGEDFEPYFLSLESLLLTCLDWVRDPTYDAEVLAPEDEMTAWQRHNPGLMD